MKLKNGYEITGIPNRAEYHKNKNGLYTVDIKDYLCTKPDGEECYCSIRIPNAKIPVDDNEGTIGLDINDIDNIEFYNANNNSSDNTIFEFIIENQGGEYHSRTDL